MTLRCILVLSVIATLGCDTDSRETTPPGSPGPAGAAGTQAGVGEPMASGGVGGAGAGGGGSAGTAGSGGASAGSGGQGGVAGEGGAGNGVADECASTIVGALHSPGGNVLPHPCEPFHPTTNNPYAVRCVDAWDWYDSGYPGDDFCILPPPPDKGIQYGVHPQGLDWYAQVSQGDLSGYQNVSPQFTLPSGGEGDFNYYTSTGGAPEFRFYRSYARMRAGSHHMIVSADAKKAQLETWGPGSSEGLFGSRQLPGAQRPDDNVPTTLGKPVEDAGYYTVMPADTGVTFNMHHFNATEGQILKEAWTNVWFETDATHEVALLLGLDSNQPATMAISPGATVDYHYTLNTPQRTRLVSLLGHRHAWTTNFSAWLVRETGETEILYQSFDWYDEPTYRYDSLTTNPSADHTKLMDGGHSGTRWLEPNETLHFNCRIQYTDARAAAVSAPRTPAENGVLRFANQAFNAEMCILFGQTAEGPKLDSPVASFQPLPDFATAE